MAVKNLVGTAVIQRSSFRDAAGSRKAVRNFGKPHSTILDPAPTTLHLRRREVGEPNFRPVAVELAIIYAVALQSAFRCAALLRRDLSGYPRSSGSSA